MTRIVTAAGLARCGLADVEAMARARELVIAVAGGGELRGDALAAALHCGWFIAGPDTSLLIDTAPAWSGAVWRLGPRSLATLMATGRSLSAAEALAVGLCDQIAGSTDDAVTIARHWIGMRSELALDAGAALIRRRGGDDLERAVFAWLFSTGEPQEGLAAFLAKRRAMFT